MKKQYYGNRYWYIESASYPVAIGSLFEKVVGDDSATSLDKIAGSGYIGTNLELFAKSMLFQVLFIITTCGIAYLNFTRKDVVIQTIRIISSWGLIVIYFILNFML